MHTHPEMVGGPGRFDTLLMAEAGGKLVSKVGAEGYLGIGVLPGVMAPGSPGLGVALKIADGDGFGRARGAVALSILSQLGILSAAELTPLAAFGPVRSVTNRRNLTVGKMRPIYKLN
jgi:L-asparaginase II